jgi:hypothetical protein
LVRIVEPGDVEVWVGSHAAASGAVTTTEDSTGGAIANGKVAEAHDIPGAATARAVVAITGDVHEVTADDPRWVEVKVVPA